MFDTLTDKFNNALKKLSGRGRISEQNVREAMAEVRNALLEADVHYQVVKQFCDDVLAQAVGQEVLSSLRPSEMMIKIVYDELARLMGPVDTHIMYVQPGPTVIMMCGLQGSGKTTTCGKLAAYLKQRGKSAMLAACGRGNVLLPRRAGPLRRVWSGRRRRRQGRAQRPEGRPQTGRRCPTARYRRPVAHQR